LFYYSFVVVVVVVEVNLCFMWVKLAESHNSKRVSCLFFYFLSTLFLMHKPTRP